MVAHIHSLSMLEEETGQSKVQERFSNIVNSKLTWAT